MDRKLGEIPIMVKTNKCHLHGMTTKQLVQHGEEPFEFGGFFIANGNEKVRIIALSTTEAEYNALSESVKLVMYLRAVLADIGYEQTVPSRPREAASIFFFITLQPRNGSYTSL